VQPIRENSNCPRRLFKHEKKNLESVAFLLYHKNKNHFVFSFEKRKLKLSKLLSVANLSLRDKKLRACAPKSELKKGQNAWAALRASKEKARYERTSSILVPLFYQIRTYFQNKH